MQKNGEEAQRISKGNPSGARGDTGQRKAIKASRGEGVERGLVVCINEALHAAANSNVACHAITHARCLPAPWKAFATTRSARTTRSKSCMVGSFSIAKRKSFNV